MDIIIVVVVVVVELLLWSHYFGTFSPVLCLMDTERDGRWDYWRV